MELLSPRLSDPAPDAQVRLAYPQDVDQLVALGAAFHAEYRQHFAPMDRDAVAFAIRSAIANATAIILEDRGEILGALILRTDRYWWSTENFLTDLFFYIRPEHRNYAAVRGLIKIAKAMSRGRGLPLCLAVSSGNDLARKDLLFKRLGFTPLGAIYRWS